MLSLHNIGPASGGVQTKPAMNLKITFQTLRRIERLLDGWQSSGDIPAIERDLACDLLRRAYDDIFFSDKNTATAPEAPLAENTLADRTNEKAVSEAADTPTDTPVDAAADALIADVVPPVGLAGLAQSGEAAEGTPEEFPENAEAVEDPATENTPVEVSAEDPATETASVEEPAEDPAEEDASVVTSVDEPASVEESVSVEKFVDEPASVEAPVEENVSIGTPVETPVGEDAPVEAPVGEAAEDEIPVEEFGEAGDAVEESGDAASSAEVAETPIPETSADIVIDPVFEVFTDEDEDAEEPDGTEEPEDADALESVALVDAVNVVDAVEAVGPAEDMEIEVMEDMEAEETEQPADAPDAIRPAEATVEPAAEPGPQPTMPPAETSTGETPADAAASNAETLEEMAARFKNASGRRRKSRRAFMSLYDDDETARREARNGQLELSDWGVEPSDPSAKLRHTRELFGLPVDDLDTMPEPAPQPAAVADVTGDEIEVEVIDFVDDDNHAKSDTNAKPTPEPTSVPTEPTPSPAAAPAREAQDNADDDQPFDEAVVALEDSDDAPSAVSPLDLPKHSDSSDAESFDSIEMVEIADADEEVSGIDEDKTQHTDRTEVADQPAKSEPATPASPAAPAASATEPAAVRDLYGREQKLQMPASTTVLGEVMGHDVPTVGDSLGRRPDVAGWPEVADDLNRAISVGDRFVLLRDLFDGDQALCDRTLKRLSTFDDLDDCMIWITENFAWNANSEGAKLIMGLLERKLG